MLETCRANKASLLESRLLEEQQNSQVQPMTHFLQPLQTVDLPVKSDSMFVDAKAFFFDVTTEIRHCHVASINVFLHLKSECPIALAYSQALKFPTRGACKLTCFFWLPMEVQTTVCASWLSELLHLHISYYVWWCMGSQADQTQQATCRKPCIRGYSWCLVCKHRSCKRCCTELPQLLELFNCLRLWTRADDAHQSPSCTSFPEMLQIRAARAESAIKRLGAPTISTVFQQRSMQGDEAQARGLPAKGDTVPRGCWSCKRSRCYAHTCSRDVEACC